MASASWTTGSSAVVVTGTSASPASSIVVAVVRAIATSPSWRSAMSASSGGRPGAVHLSTLDIISVMGFDVLRFERSGLLLACISLKGDLVTNTKLPNVNVSSEYTCKIFLWHGRLNAAWEEDLAYCIEELYKTGHVRRKSWNAFDLPHISKRRSPICEYRRWKFTKTRSIERSCTWNIYRGCQITSGPPAVWHVQQMLLKPRGGN